jgi:hypothetical protein
MNSAVATDRRGAGRRGTTSGLNQDELKEKRRKKTKKKKRAKGEEIYKRHCWSLGAGGKAAKRACSKKEVQEVREKRGQGDVGGFDGKKETKKEGRSDRVRRE